MIRNQNHSQYKFTNKAFGKLFTNHGSVLLAAYSILFVLLTLSLGVASMNMSEVNFARRHHSSVTAFWLAESGLSVYLDRPELLEESVSFRMEDELGTVLVERDDSEPLERRLSSTGQVGQIQRRVQMVFPALAPAVFQNALASGGNLIASGAKSSVLIQNKVRIAGELKQEGRFARVQVQDLRQGIDKRNVTLTYPDANANGKVDEYEDFVAYNKRLLRQNYSADEVLYLKGNQTFVLTPSSRLDNKKIVYVEGKKGGGDVVIQFNSVVNPGQNLTIITGGNVTFNQAGAMPEGAQLNVIAWSGYSETSVLPSSHTGTIFTHGAARFDNMLDTSVTNGNVIANEGIVFNDVWSTKIFKWSDTSTKGIVPPGFEGLLGGDVSGYSDEPNAWREVTL